MKNTIYVLLVAFLTIPNLTAQDFSDIDKSPMDVTIIRNQNHSPMARVIYSRLSKNGRDIFGNLVMEKQKTKWNTQKPNIQESKNNLLATIKTNAKFMPRLAKL